MPLPTFLIAGVPRAGTTSLAAYLMDHPDVYIAANKELHFFSSRSALGMDWYRAQFAGKPSATQRGEATPGYLFRPEAVEMMARTIPDAKVIIVFREPVERAYSHFWLNRWRGIEPLSFEQAVEAEEDRMNAARVDHRLAYVGMGGYADQMRRLLSYYARNQVHTVLFEDLKARPHDVVRSVCRFLGIEERVAPITGERWNHRGPVRSVRIAALARHCPGPICRSLRRWNTYDTEYPAMRQETRAVLIDRFRVANRSLPGLIGEQPSWTSLPVQGSKSEDREDA